MKKIHLLILFIFIVSFLNVGAQNGIVLYSTHIQVVNDIPSEHNDFFKEMINAAESHQFELRFNKNQSSFKFMDDLSKDQNASLTHQNIARSGFSSSIDVYIDRNKKEELQQKIDGTLILGEYNIDGWEILNDSKNISEYLCYKAIRKVPVVDRNGVSKVNIITAWFAPSLPFNYGPQNFYGLPGLILELTKNKTTFLATKIVLDKENIQIDFPKGKTISKEVYDKKLRENYGM